MGGALASRVSLFPQNTKHTRQQNQQKKTKKVEADIKPFRGLLLGLFFVSVGSSIKVDVLMANWDVILWMLAGLVSLKAGINTALGPLFGLSKAESIRTGFMLAQGGEFAFVLLSLANQLELLPSDLNQILIIVVVLSMALTPGLAAAGKALADIVDANEAPAARGIPEALDSADFPGRFFVC